VRPEGLGKLKKRNSMISPAFDPATFQLPRAPSFYYMHNKILGVEASGAYIYHSVLKG
jgi:hypothetical protein